MLLDKRILHRVSKLWHKGHTVYLTLCWGQDINQFKCINNKYIRGGTWMNKYILHWSFLYSVYDTEHFQVGEPRGWDFKYNKQEGRNGAKEKKPIAVIFEKASSVEASLVLCTQSVSRLLWAGRVTFPTTCWTPDEKLQWLAFGDSWSRIKKIMKDSMPIFSTIHNFKSISHDYYVSLLNTLAFHHTKYFKQDYFSCPFLHLVQNNACQFRQTEFISRREASKWNLEGQWKLPLAYQVSTTRCL